MNYDMLRAMIRFYATRAGFSLISAHSLRHAFATHMYQRGADIRAIQLMLGHAHLQTTTIYAHALTHEMRDMVEAHHPRGALYQGGISLDGQHPVGNASRQSQHAGYSPHATSRPILDLWKNSRYL